MAVRPALVAGLRDARAKVSIARKFGLVVSQADLDNLSALEKAEADAASARAAAKKPNTFYEKVIVGGYEARAARRAAKAGRETVKPARKLTEYSTAELETGAAETECKPGPEMFELNRRAANGSKLATAALERLAAKFLAKKKAIFSAQFYRAQ